VAGMRAAINDNAQPITQSAWLCLFREAGFEQITAHQGPMTLLSPSGLIADEGLKGTLSIVNKALKTENRAQFIKMFNTFRRNRHHLNYIVVCSIKPQTSLDRS